MLDPGVDKEVHKSVSRVVNEVIGRSAHANLVLEVLSTGHVTEVSKSAFIITVISFLACGLSHLVPVVEDGEGLIGSQTVCQSRYLIGSEILHSIVADEIVKKLPCHFVFAIGAVDIVEEGLEVGWNHEFFIDLDDSEGGVLLGVGCE